jgi:hypothetical protein
LLNYNDITNESINFLYYNNETFKQKALLLEELNYSVFSDDYFIPSSTKLVNLTLNNNQSSSILYSGTLIDCDYYLSISGWAFIEDTNYTGDTFLVLNSTNNTFIFETDKTLRKDVSEHFNLDLDYSGFNVVVDKRRLLKGNYSLLIYIVQEHKSALKLINNDIMVN